MKKNNHPVEGPDGLVYTARLPLSSATLNWLADLLRGHFKKIGSRWRALPAGKIAGIVLAVLRCDQRPGDLAGGNGIHRTTVTRWVREVVGLLAARAPRLDRALKKIARKGGGVVLLDGSVIRTRRRTGAENRKNYSGKNKCHGLLVIALTDDRGRLLWVSAARPGRTSEITACRHDKLTAHLRAAGLGAIADLGFGGLDDSGPDADPAVITGYKAARNRPLTRGQKLSNKALAAVRAPVEHGFAHLKNWRVLGKVRTDPRWATALVRALLVLTHQEVAR
ncbi:transposase family protein [Streptomyces marianii]|uniref:IS5/IS1182 family transposase n=1 Tax=Streptomyces marianii TaxID=1817406 RepID=A0A5R9DRF0_9ACTN|nr:transposase family protein [Streptomyces marianii]TLQ38978.1 IS5/IS1182 family transposase [Streptomyces marianii]